MEGPGDAVPRQPLGPVRQKTGVGRADGALVLGPRRALDLHLAMETIHAAHGADEVDQNAPKGNDLKTPHGQRAVVRRMASATRTEQLAFPARLDRDGQSRLLLIEPVGLGVNKALVFLDAVEDRFDVYFVSTPAGLFLVK